MVALIDTHTHLFAEEFDKTSWVLFVPQRQEDIVFLCRI